MSYAHLTESIEQCNKRYGIQVDKYKELDVTVSQQSAGNVDAVTQVLDIWVEQFAAALANDRQ